MRFHLPRAAPLVLAALPLVAGLPASARAQLDGVGALFERVTDINIYYQRGGFLPRSSVFAPGIAGRNAERYGLYGYGLELSFEVGYVTRAARGRPVREVHDTTLTLTGVTITRRDGRADTTLTFAAQVSERREEPRDTLYLLELALGYGQISGFRPRRGDTDVRASLRELPSLAIYASREGGRGRLAEYFGIRSGLAQLQSARFYAEDGAVWSAQANAFQVGLTAGAAFELSSGLSAFLETSYTYRTFDSIEWEGDGPPPLAAPRSLNLSTLALTAGFQFRVRQ